jgi:hypothetical protein
MTEDDLSYLQNLGPDRTVKNVMLGTSVGPYSGFLVKFAMFESKKRELLGFFRGADVQLHGAFKAANKDGRLPKITEQENDRLVATMPKITTRDWDVGNECLVAQVKAISFTNAMCFEFPLQIGGEPRRYALPLNVARFLGEYVDQHFSDNMRFVPPQK